MGSFLLPHARCNARDTLFNQYKEEELN